MEYPPNFSEKVGRGRDFRNPPVPSAAPPPLEKEDLGARNLLFQRGIQRQRAILIQALTVRAESMPTELTMPGSDRIYMDHRILPG